MWLRCLIVGRFCTAWKITLQNVPNNFHTNSRFFFINFDRHKMAQIHHFFQDRWINNYKLSGNYIAYHIIVYHTYASKTLFSRRNVCISWMDWHKNMIIFTMHIQCTKKWGSKIFKNKLQEKHKISYSWQLSKLLWKKIQIIKNDSLLIVNL